MFGLAKTPGSIVMNSAAKNIDQRLAVIELGSRAIRLLVADVSGSHRLRPVETQVRKTGVMESLCSSDRDLLTELRSATRNIDELVQRATRQGAEKIAVFGTEAIRQAAVKRVFAESGLSERITHILTGREEALCSIVAGSITMSVIDPKLRGLIVIDHGAGSLEVARGRVGGNYDLEMSASLPLGGSHLLEAFRTCGRDLERLRELVRPELGNLELGRTDPLPVVVMGTVATKCAWLTKRQGLHDRYDPKRVDGVGLPLKGLRQIYEHAKSLNEKGDPNRAWERFQEFINPGERGGDAAERVATGVIPIIEILSGLGADAFYVSSLGTRHGFALLWANAPEALAG